LLASLSSPCNGLLLRVQSFVLFVSQLLVVFAFFECKLVDLVFYYVVEFEYSNPMLIKLLVTMDGINALARHAEP
jgi:hypothetical protein